MNKFDSKPLPASIAFPAASHADLPISMNLVSTHRLIVLIPDAELGSANLPQRIWEIASSSGFDVLFLGLFSDPSHEAQLRRKLITIAAIIKDSNVCTDIMIKQGYDWVKEVKNIWQPGDVLACYAEQKIGLLRKPLDQVLQSNLETQIYNLSDHQPAQKTMSNLFSGASSWLGSLAIIGSFFWVEAKIVELPKDWTHTSLLYICIFIELGLIWLWNSISTQL